jgi:dethiobiotin synthetase
MSTILAVTGIGTGVGKTVVSAIIAESLKANYWKPIQAGDLDSSDSIVVDGLTNSVKVLPEGFKLETPMSPHEAAKIDGVNISLDSLTLPSVEGNLVIEGAGGLMVPFNYEGETYLDLFRKWRIPVVVVSRHYLGSINHTLLTIELLQKEGIEIKGIVFNGDEHPSTEKIILSKSGVQCLGRIPEAEQVNKEFVSKHVNSIEL